MNGKEMQSHLQYCGKYRRDDNKMADVGRVSVLMIGEQVPVIRQYILTGYMASYAIY
jgi:hypothetical protein